MAFCLPRSLNIPGPRIRADKFHATLEMWELNPSTVLCRDCLGLAFRQEMFLIKLSDLVESSHK